MGSSLRRNHFNGKSMGICSLLCKTSLKSRQVLHKHLFRLATTYTLMNKAVKVQECDARMTPDGNQPGQ